jgi:hypothetical protein
VLDLVVAANAVDRLVCDVDGVDPGEVPVTLELLGLIVACDAPLTRRFTLSLDDAQVAALAGDASTHEFTVVESDRTDHDVARRDHVAAVAAGNGHQLAIALHSLEMACEAGAARDLEVLVHDDLRMTARAAELPAGLRCLQVCAVIEPDPER